MIETDIQPLAAPVLLEHKSHRRVWLLSAFFVIGILTSLWILWGKDYFLVRKWGIVVPGEVYRSGQISRFRIQDILVNYHISRVVYLSDEDEDLDAIAERKICRELKIPREVITMAGNGITPPTLYVNAVAAIAQARKRGEPVLVHCHAGAQRTGAVVALYRLLVLKETPQTVRQELLDFGHDSQRNPKLISYLNQQMPTVAKMLFDRGVISSVPDSFPMIEP